jgi:thioredoxin-like negative regulator of GroEL
MQILVFFWSRTCGHSRRMDSLVDHFLRVHRDQLKLAKVELSDRPDLAQRFGITEAPTLVMLDNLLEVGRLEGRNTLPAIKDTFEPFLDLEPAGAPAGVFASAC